MIYVADSDNSAIRTIDPNGLVRTAAGGPSRKGYVDGAAADARLVSPKSVTLDKAGNLYFVDVVEIENTNTCTPWHRLVIRKISASGVVSTINDLGQIRITGPVKLAVDSLGNVFVTIIETFENNIVVLCPTPAPSASYVRKISTNGLSSLWVGSKAIGAVDGQGDQARFDSLTDISIDATDNIYVADSRNGAIRRVSPQGIVSTVVGQLPPSGSLKPVGTLTLGALPGVVPYPDTVSVGAQFNLYIGAANLISSRSRVVLTTQFR